MTVLHTARIKALRVGEALNELALIPAPKHLKERIPLLPQKTGDSVLLRDPVEPQIV